MSSSVRAHKTRNVKRNGSDENERIEILRKVEKLAKQNDGPSGRQLAQALHQQADFLNNNGDYETALVLYHRAASVYPRDSGHNIAARRTAAAISSSTNPTGALRKFMNETNNDVLLSRNFSPAIAAHQASTILRNSVDPLNDVKKILKYFDCCADNPGGGAGGAGGNSKRMMKTRIARTRKILEQLNKSMSVKLHEMKKSFAAGNYQATINIGNDLFDFTKALQDNPKHGVAVYRYLALAHLSLKRHDRAISAVSKMIQAAKESGDIKLISRSLAILGKVHLTFGHLEAAAKAWERLSIYLNEPTPKAWILHEIGRCYFEMSNHSKALKMASRCVEWAEKGHSIKWMCYGKLLSGQALVELGRLAEGLEALGFVAQASIKAIEDSTILHYIQVITRRVKEAVKKFPTFHKENKFMNDVSGSSSSSSSSSSEKLFKSRYVKAIDFSNTAGDIENGKSLSARVLGLKKLRDMQETDDKIYSSLCPTVNAKYKELNKNSNNTFDIQDNEKVAAKLSNTKFCPIINKWKCFLSERKTFGQSQFDLKASNFTSKVTDLSENISTTASNALPVDKKTLGIEIVKRSCLIKNHVENYWKLPLSRESSRMNVDHPQADMTLTTGRTYSIASVHSFDQQPLSSSHNVIFNNNPNNSDSNDSIKSL